MGLDMYLRGEKSLSTWNDKNPRFEDDKRVCEVVVELGYWRKHPNLHGFIVNQFAEGVDECQPIELSEEDIEQILLAIDAKQLPETSGFFFGQSDDSEEQREVDRKIFKDALEWVRTRTPGSGEWKTVVYRASW